MQICTLTQTHNHASIPPLSVLQAGCPSCRPTNSVKELKENPVTKSLQFKVKYYQASQINAVYIFCDYY